MDSRRTGIRKRGSAGSEIPGAERRRVYSRLRLSRRRRFCRLSSRPSF